MKIIFTNLLLLLAIFAQGQSTLEYGQAVYGDLLTNDQVDTYHFDATAGDRIYIRMRDAETPVDACFLFYGPDGQLISNPCGDGGIVSIKDFTVTTSGTYAIEAYDANHNDSGKYGISLNLLNSPDYATPIACGHDGEKEVTVTTGVDSYTFTAEQGDKLLARMRSANSSFESEIEVYDLEGNLLAADHGSGLSTINGFEIPATGTYTLLANDRNGNDLGIYGLSIQMINRQDCAISLDCGENTAGSIATIAGMEAYTFRVGDQAPVIAQARSLNTSFETQLFVYDKNGNEIAQTDGSSKLQNITANLPQGDYLLLTMDKGGNDKADYGIALQYLGTQNCAEEIHCPNNSSTVSFETLAAMQSYTLNATKGSAITPESGRLTDGFDPEILIYDRNANLIADGYSFSVTTLADVEIPEDGPYYAIVRDWHGNDLGDFKFSITSDEFGNELPTFNTPELPTITADCEVSLERPTASDPCEGTILGRTTDPMEYNEQGTYEVTWVFENATGATATQSQTIVIQDTEAPNIDCQTVLPITLTADGEYFLSQEDFAARLKDNCTGIAWVEIETSYFDCSMVGEHEVMLWVADNAGNETSCSVLVTVEGSESCAPSCGDLPEPWQLYDVGDGHHSQEGSVCYDPTNPTFEITSYGEDIFGRHDEFTFVYQELCGSGVIQAKVSDLSSDAKYAMGGIMMRKDNHSGAIYAALLATPEKGIFYQTRQKKNQHTLFEAHEGEPPAWIKLVRKDKLISGYISKDAIDWELACEIDVKLDECYHVGIIASAYDTSLGNTATIEHVEVYNIDVPSSYVVRPPSIIEMTDPCMYAIDERNETPVCQNKPERKLKINVFPNPTADRVTIDGAEFRGTAVTITILDRLGKVHFKGDYDEAPASLPINLKRRKVPNGIYTVMINDGTNIATQKFLVIDEG